MDERIAEFTGITGASDVAARHVLEMCDGDLANAITLWYTDEELQRSLSAPIARVIHSASGAFPQHESASGTGPSNAISIPDDESDEILTGADDSASEFGAGEMEADEVNSMARTAQEDGDAAMARRLQEEFYGASSGAGADGDVVRAPISRTTETLIGPGGYESNEIQEAYLEAMRRRSITAARSPFSQSVWSEGSRPGRSGPSAAQSSRAERLAELFRPPYDLMTLLPWDDTRDLGKTEKKWILVDLQDPSVFQCQELNRDVWKDEAVRDIVKANFLFLQYEKNDPRAENYIAFYFPHQSHENQDNYPHVSIIDPRTGEEVKVWSGVPFPHPLDFYQQLGEFLDRYSLDSNCKNPVSKAKRPAKAVNLDRMTEEEMLEMAMQNSLGNGEAGSSSLQDPDALTKEDDSKGKGKAAAKPEPELAAEVSAFASIAPDRPHEEPANDPATTTRIQFKHPNGRVIRRFRTEEPVLRIFEWLKAEPLEGTEGQEFELKTMPQGRDLWEERDKTIANAGLKQATVMVEFV